MRCYGGRTMVAARLLEAAIIVLLVGIAGVGTLLLATSFGVAPTLATVPRATVIDGARPHTPPRPYQIQVAKRRLIVGAVLLIGAGAALLQIYEVAPWLPLGG
jgi:hypothetical protein